VAAGRADHAVAAAPRDVGLAGGGRGAHGDLGAGLGPALRDLGGVDLGAARLGIVEVAPREDADPPEARLRGDVAELGNGGVVVHRQGGRARTRSAPLGDPSRPAFGGAYPTGPRV